MLPFLSALFCSYFIFDTLGDQDKDGVSILTISMTVLMASIPGLVWVSEKVWTAWLQGRQTNNSVRPYLVPSTDANDAAAIQLAL